MPTRHLLWLPLLALALDGVPARGDEPLPFIVGADISWVQQQEAEAVKGEKLNIVAVTNPRGGAIPIVVRDTDDEETRKSKEEQFKKGITETFVSISDEVREELEKDGIKVCLLCLPVHLYSDLLYKGRKLQNIILEIYFYL